MLREGTLVERGLELTSDADSRRDHLSPQLQAGVDQPAERAL
jgi:hypothetical protein